jgi:hypothetical protein
VVTLACKRIAYLEDREKYDRGDDDRVDVRGDDYRDICRLGLAPPADAAPALKALQAKRDLLIAAVDAVLPPAYLPDLQTFLTSTDFMARYDDGTTLHAIDKLIELLQLMADDAEFAPALARLNHRLGYMPTDQGLGTLRAVVNYPELHDFLLILTDAITEGGAARKEFDNFIRALSIALRHAEVAAGAASGERTGALALELLLGESSWLNTASSAPPPRAASATSSALPVPM